MENFVVRRNHVSVFYFVVIFSLFACSSGQVELGMMMGEVRELLGEPDMNTVKRTQSTTRYWYYYIGSSVDVGAAAERRKQTLFEGTFKPSYKSNKYVFENGILVDIVEGVGGKK